MKYKSVKIIASLTTTPHRIDLIKPTIDSILNQTIPISAIELNVPYVFKRTGEKYKIPEWLIDLEKNNNNNKCELRIYRTEDYGAITKVAPTLMRHRENNDVYVWSLDDDIEYPLNMLAVLYREYYPNKPYVLSHSAGNWKYDEKTNDCIDLLTNRTEGFYDFCEGFGTILYPAFLIQDDFENYVIETSETLDNRNSDDVIISNYLAMKNIKIYNCAYPYSKDSKLLDDDNYLKFGFCEDALHQQGGGNIVRYLRVFNWLKDKKLNGWIKNNYNFII